MRSATVVHTGGNSNDRSMARTVLRAAQRLSSAARGGRSPEWVGWNAGLGYISTTFDEGTKNRHGELVGNDWQGDGCN